MTTILVVLLEARRFAFRIEDVAEVVRAVAVTPLPGAPPVVEGVIDLRGATVPVLNLRRRFALPARDEALSDRFVVAEAAGRRIALRVDEVQDVDTLDDAALERAEGLWAAGARILGAARTADGLVMVGDLAAFLSQTEAAALDEAMAAGAQAPP